MLGLYMADEVKQQCKDSLTQQMSVTLLAYMKSEADNVGQRWVGIFNVAWPSPNRPPDPGDRAAV